MSVCVCKCLSSCWGWQAPLPGVAATQQHSAAAAAAAAAAATAAGVSRQIASQARLMSAGLRKLAANAHKTNTTVMFINQLRHKVRSAWQCVDHWAMHAGGGVRVSSLIQPAALFV